MSARRFVIKRVRVDNPRLNDLRTIGEAAKQFKRKRRYFQHFIDTGRLRVYRRGNCVMLHISQLRELHKLSAAKRTG